MMLVQESAMKCLLCFEEGSTKKRGTRTVLGFFFDSPAPAGRRADIAMSHRRHMTDTRRRTTWMSSLKRHGHTTYPVWTRIGGDHTRGLDLPGV